MLERLTVAVVGEEALARLLEPAYNQAVFRRAFSVVRDGVRLQKLR